MHECMYASLHHLIKIREMSLRIEALIPSVADSGSQPTLTSLSGHGVFAEIDQTFEIFAVTVLILLRPPLLPYLSALITRREITAAQIK